MKLRACVAVAALALGALATWPGVRVAHAATFTVNTTADTPDLTPGDGVCDDATAHCSIHAAIDETNALGGTNLINVPAGTYLLSLPGSVVSSPGLTVAGAGASSTIIDGNHSATVGTPLSNSGTLNISGVTIQNGAAGGLVSTGSLTVDSMAFLNNTASVEGGGLSIQGGAASVVNSRFTGNAVTQPNGIGGGAISNRIGSLTVIQSTMDHNTSAGYGGAIGTEGLTYVTNVTITANAATGAGGGGISTGTGQTSIQNSTIDANTSGSYGGGIESYVNGSNKYVLIKNTIISNNTATASGANCFGATAIASQGYNIDSGTTCSLGGPGDQSSTDPMLAPLQDNGGPTPTQAIGPGSPALDQASPDCPGPYTDQRGYPRPMGPACDIGSFEYQPFPSASLPALMNNAYGGYSTTSYVRNDGASPAAINLVYYDSNGGFVGMDWIPGLAPGATWIVSQTSGHSFASGQAGSGILYSNQPISSFVNEFHSSLDATSYTGIPISMSGSTELWAPTITNGAYGGYTTGIGLINQSPVTSDVTVTYRDLNGVIRATQTITGLAPHSYRALYSGDASLGLPSGFAGTATLQSSSGQISAVVNEVGPGAQFSSYGAVNASATMLDAPVALNNAYGGYYTGMAIQNATGSSGTVTITYYDMGGASTIKTFPLAANGYLGIYQGSATDGPAAGAYTATLISTVAIAAVVNEVAPSATSVMQSTAYNTFAGGAGSVALALVENAGSDGWSTGEGIMNTGNVSVTVGVDYFDVATGAAIGTHESQVLAPNAFWGLYQPTGGLPPGARASAVITAPGGTVAVICNESSSTRFMSYGGQ